MTLDSLITDLRERDIRLRRSGDALSVDAAPGALTPELRARVMSHRAELLALLGDGTAEAPAIDRTLPQPLSFVQQRLWILDRLVETGSLYNVPLVLRIEGALQASLLPGILSDLVARHGALRTIYRDDGQHLSSERSVTLDRIDLAAIASPEAALADAVAVRLAAPFDLRSGRLLRATLATLAPESHVLILVLHHIACDGWSLNLLLHELSQRYEDAAAGTATSLPAILPDYLDYAVQQRRTADKATLQSLIIQYRDRMGGSPLGTVVTPDRPRPPVQTHAGAAVRAAMPRELVDGLRRLAGAEDASLFMAVLAAAKALLFRHTGDADIAVGVPGTLRDRPELQPVVGCFLNTLLMRTGIDAAMSGRALLQAVRRTALDAYRFAAVPFEMLVDAAQTTRDPSFSPLFQVMVFLQSEPVPTIQGETLRWRKQAVVNPTAKFDLTFEVEEHADGAAELILHYNTDLFDADRMQRMAEHFTRLAAEMARRPDSAIGHLAMLDAAEHATLDRFNAPSLPAPPFPTVHAWFEAQAASTPGGTALWHDGVPTSYAEMNAAANRLAHHLLRLGIQPGARIGIYTRRNRSMPVAMLAAMKAGGAYVPLDPAYPADRIAMTADDAGLAAILTESTIAADLPPLAGHVVALDEIAASAVAADDADPAPRTGPGDLSHLIYTSGSTGRPKGIMIEHRNVLALLQWAHAAFDAHALGHVLFSTSICFDLSVFELFAPLTMGGAVHLVENALHLPQCPTRAMVTLINTVPSAMAELLRQGAVPQSVGVINLAGEPLRRELVEQAYRLAHVRAVWNLYGPSEDTTYSTCALLASPVTEAPTIGRPLTGKQVHLLDPAGERVPLGTVGEIFISGAGVARGYLGRPELDATRFLPNPFGAGLLYRTGDLGRFLPDGRIVYLGRTDFQVKVHGFRIELGEIEQALRRHPDVRDCVVVLRDDGAEAKLIVAYAASAAGTEPSSLRAHLRAQLPAFMIPGTFVVLHALPMTPNGKIDRAALPPPVRETPGPAPGATMATGMEAKVAGIWKELLDVAQVGLDDNFFEIGGHSLLLLQMHVRLRSATGRDFPIIELFRSPTVRALARFLDDSPLDDCPGGDRAAIAAITQRTRMQRASMARKRHTSIDARI